MDAYTAWTAENAAGRIAVPREDDDKYSRGVLGVITGSPMYPGAAVLGVEAALGFAGPLGFIGVPASVVGQSGLSLRRGCRR